MAGDYGSVELVRGAIQAVEDFNHQVVLVGDSKKLEGLLSDLCRDMTDHGSQRTKLEVLIKSKITIAHASEIVGMDEAPLDSVRRKKDSSISVAFKLAQDGEVDAVVSAGNSGATMASAVKSLGRLEGVSRPGIAGIFPTLKKPLTMVDVGANVDCRPKHLFQFGVMGAAFSSLLIGEERPRIGLLSIGEERGKGNILVKKTHELLTHSSLNYIGNVEGRDTFQGDVDVIVCDGFVGNVCLKLSEGLAEAMVSMLRDEIAKNFKAQVGYLLARKAFAKFKQRTDYAEYGGAPLLGLDGTAIICHGRSNALAIKNAINIAAEMVDKKLNGLISTFLTDNSDAVSALG
jgi:glycerol-3-phosphate acyltransferase PlsX